MRTPRVDIFTLLLCAPLIGVPLVALAQTGGQQAARPPAAQYWMDVATNTITIPGMGGTEDKEEAPSPGDFIPGMGGIPSGMPGMPGMPSMNMSPASNEFGFTAGTPGRWVDIALTTQKQPAGGIEASQTIPAGVKLGPSLPLLPILRDPVQRSSTPDGPKKLVLERPKGRILLYWGCSAEVRPGQPRVLDFSKGEPKAWEMFLQGRFDGNTGARNIPGHSVWPNRKDNRVFPPDASLVGDHTVRGEGLPDSLKFTLSQAQDFMSPIALSATGELQGTVGLGWQPVSNAQAYFLNATGSGSGENEMVLWSSSELPEPGLGIINDYASGANVSRWLSEKVLLPPGTTSCAIPRGIFARAEGASLRMIAYGPELNLVHSPRPTNPKTPGNQDWIIRIRNKSTATTFLSKP